MFRQKKLILGAKTRFCGNNHKCYFETKSYKTISESFEEKFRDEQILLNSTIKCIAKCFEVHFRLESVLSSRRQMFRTEEKREEVSQQIVATFHILVCKLT